MFEIYAKKLKDNKVDKIKVDHDLGIEIVHNGNHFFINVDNFNRLYISSDLQIVLKPRASNQVFISSEN